MPRARRSWLALALLAGPAAGAGGVRELAVAWVVGDFRAPLACVVDNVPRQALRRVRIDPAPPGNPRLVARVTFFDLAAPPGTRCTSVSGAEEPNVIGAVALLWDAPTRPDMGEADFRHTLRREGGFDFKVDAGRLRVGASADASDALPTIDFAGGTARFEQVAPGSDAARQLAGFGGKRQLRLELRAPGGSPLSFELVELEPR